jgi:hypothetical protein
MQRVRRQQSSRLCAPVAPTTLFLPPTTETMSSSWRGRQRESRQRSGQPHTPRGAVVAAQTGVDVSAALRAGTRAVAAAQTGADAPAAGLTEIATFTSGATLPPRTDTMVAILRDVGAGGGWPTLTKTNYVKWAAVMRVRLQVRHMWEAVRYDNVDY